MKPFFTVFLFCFIAIFNAAHAQKYVDRVKFFSDTSAVNATLTFNMGKLLSKKTKQGLIFPATFSCKSGDSLDVNDHILMEARGHFRREYCYMPPLKLIYKNNPDAAFYHLKTLKLVSACKPNNQYDQYLLKEFICYKLYNLVTSRSLHVRLLNLNYKDSSGKKKTITKHAFLLEDIKELAKRNGCEEVTGRSFATERTNRRQMTVLSLFEYLIGNTDWAVPVYHNIILLRPKNDTVSQPFPVGYDFDYSGMVNTDYAIPDERLGTQSVRERVYRGFARTMEELDDALTIFIKQKENMYAVINNFNLLTPATKAEMKDYLDDFFTIAQNKTEVKNIFINSARRE